MADIGEPEKWQLAQTKRGKARSPGDARQRKQSSRSASESDGSSAHGGSAHGGSAQHTDSSLSAGPNTSARRLDAKARRSLSCASAPADQPQPNAAPGSYRIPHVGASTPAPRGSPAAAPNRPPRPQQQPWQTFPSAEAAAAATAAPAPAAPAAAPLTDRLAASYARAASYRPTTVMIEQAISPAARAGDPAPAPALYWMRTGFDTGHWLKHPTTTQHFDRSHRHTRRSASKHCPGTKGKSYPPPTLCLGPPSDQSEPRAEPSAAEPPPAPARTAAAPDQQIRIPAPSQTAGAPAQVHIAEHLRPAVSATADQGSGAPAGAPDQADAEMQPAAEPEQPGPDQQAGPPA